MTCIGRPSLSSGRGAELVEAERGFSVQLFSELYPLSVNLTGDSSPPRGASLTYNSRLSLSSGRGAELVEAERFFFVQLFSELYPLSVTFTGDSSPLGEPLLTFYFLRFHNQFQRRHNLLYLITNAIKIFINSIIRKSYYCYFQIIKISCPSFIIFSMLIFVMLTPI